MSDHPSQHNRVITSCKSCSAPFPFALLIPVDTGSPLQLPAEDCTLGRSEASALRLDDNMNVSRRHARFLWRGEHLELEDVGSTRGTFVNGLQLEPGTPLRLRDGDRVSFGDRAWTYRTIMPDADSATPAQVEIGPASRLGSLDPAEVVRVGLEMLRATTGMQRAYLFAAPGTLGERAPRMAGLLDPEDPGGPPVSRSSISQAIESGGIVSRIIDPSGAVEVTVTMRELDLRRIWVCPVSAPGEPAMAVIYLDSQLTAPPMPASVEAQVQVLAVQIGLALRNALLYSRLADLNATLEQRVRERTLALERSQAQLIAQDRLATLGRLVAGIAHELNNPVGAIVSMSGTAQRILSAERSVEQRAAEMYADPEVLKNVEPLLRRLADLARGGVPDSRQRRELEAAWSATLAAAGVSASDMVASKLARTGLAVPSRLPEAHPLRGARAMEFASLLEEHFMLRRSLVSMQECAANIARIVSGLKTYSHLDMSPTEVTDVRRGLQAALDVLQSRVPPGVRVETQLEDVPVTLHRPGELIQVWTNLIDNALRAMGEHGTLSISCRGDSRHIVVEVADSGSGVPSDLGERIFELDVTTRGPGAGLGLGLAICRQIIERNHGGHIGFTSRPGLTTFRVELPIRPAGG